MKLTKSTVNLIADGFVQKFEQDPASVVVDRMADGGIRVCVNKAQYESVSVQVSKFGFEIELIIIVPNPSYSKNPTNPFGHVARRYLNQEPSPYISTRQTYRCLLFRSGYVYKKLAEIIYKQEQAVVDAEVATTMNILDKILNLSSMSLEKDILRSGDDK